MPAQGVQAAATKIQAFQRRNSASKMVAALKGASRSTIAAPSDFAALPTALDQPKAAEAGLAARVAQHRQTMQPQAAASDVFAHRQTMQPVTTAGRIPLSRATTAFTSAGGSTSMPAQALAGA